MDPNVVPLKSGQDILRCFIQVAQELQVAPQSGKGNCSKIWHTCLFFKPTWTVFRHHRILSLFQRSFIFFIISSISKIAIFLSFSPQFQIQFKYFTASHILLVCLKLLPQVFNFLFSIRKFLQFDTSSFPTSTSVK